MAGQLRYATAAVDNSPELLAIADALTARTGRPRNIPIRALLIACCLHARVDPTNMYRTRIADLLVSLNAAQRRDLGIAGPVSYSQVERAALKLDRAARDGITLPANDHQDAQTLNLDAVMSLICSAALPPGFITTATVAADGMDFESPARPQGFVDKRTGEVRKIPRSTTTLDTKEFAVYLDQIIKLVGESGYVVPEPRWYREAVPA